MRFDSLTALVAASSALLGVSAGPLVAKRQGTTSASSGAPTAGLVVSTMSNNKPTTFEVVAPLPTKSGSAQSSGDSSAVATATDSEVASATSAAPTRTGTPLPPSHDFPSCHSTDAKPFCLPNNASTLYVDSTYYATWNPDVLPINSTVTVKIQFINNSLQEVWSSAETENSWGFVSVTMKKEWMQGYDAYNLTFYAISFEANNPLKKSIPYKGPTVLLTNKPPSHYQPPQRTKTPNKLGLMIGLPVSLGFVVVVVIGLFVGMRKHRTIGLGNIMGRRNKGYGVGKSRRQRMGLGKTGAIRLDNREEHPRSQYHDAPAHTRGDSLGSLVSDDGIRPAPRGNQFRDELQRQKTGR
ncbi:uncharacterized protein BDR25DRAFT_342938 [Lindgomyces ingoldianus]|uniref:Uncharacterized protein n=1 Tax=Lindgomyces ingoldianus TaxID=673940 RepID=A0ACB6QUF7_9PLEO|nr:uncharacterized protein BDR25DRAFT_342938 [Lindgomyces ingoldianus]KAF2470649.1 hypothetical protein BDR25DRAFT_342938 [Lindgomyces ingoldianus]